MRKLRTQHEPPAAGPQLELIRVIDFMIHPYVILAKGIFGLYTHWDAKGNKGKGCSAPCFGDPNVCDGCKHNLPERWKGYLHVKDLQTQKDGFLELTPTAAAMLKAQLAGLENYRLCRINVSRTQGGAKGRLKVTVFDSVKDDGSYPRERCPTETLSKLWKLKPDIDEDDPPSIKIHGGTPSDKPRPDGRLAASV